MAHGDKKDTLTRDIYGEHLSIRLVYTRYWAYPFQLLYCHHIQTRGCQSIFISCFMSIICILQKAFEQYWESMSKFLNAAQFAWRPRGTRQKAGYLYVFICKFCILYFSVLLKFIISYHCLGFYSMPTVCLYFKNSNKNWLQHTLSGFTSYRKQEINPCNLLFCSSHIFYYLMIVSFSFVYLSLIVFIFFFS